MVDVTLFEVHLDDSSLTASTPFSRGTKEVEASDDGPPAESSASSRGTLFAAVVGILFLVAVTVVARRTVLDGDEDELELASLT